MSSQSAFAAAADALAGSVLDALNGAGDTVQLAQHVDDAPDALAALAAIRVIGADTFAPHILAATPLDAQDAAVVAKSFAAFPAPGSGSPDPGEQRTMAWRDWATAQLLDRLGAEGTPRIDAAPPRDDNDLADTTDWRAWTVRMAQLAPLATLGIDSPVHEAARGNALALSRGVSRSVLRRDFTTAVRLIRWLAWLRHEGTELPLDPGLAAEHVWLVGGAGARTALDLAVAHHLLERPPRTGPSARTPSPSSSSPASASPPASASASGPTSAPTSAPQARPPLVAIPESVTRVARSMTDRALSWLHTHRALGGLPPGTTETMADPDSVYKPLGETTLAASLILRDGVAGPGRLAAAQSLMDFTWEQFRRGDMIYERQLRHTLMTDPLEMYAPFVRCGFRHRDLDRLLAHRARMRSVDSVEMLPNRRLAVANAARVVGLDSGADRAALARATWLGATPEPWAVNWITAYAMTHTVFHLTDWGADPAGLPPELASYVRDWLPVWIDIWREVGQWDLVAELLIVGASLPEPYCAPDDWEGLAAHQHEDGLVPRDSDPVDDDPHQRFKDHQHTVVVTAVAGSIALARAAGEW